MRKLLFCLANTAPDMQLIAVANEFNISEDKPIRIPYGKYPYGSYKMKDGSTVFITQVFDHAAAEAWNVALANEIAAGRRGYPIYHGHPDADAPEIAAKYPDKRAKGWGNRMTVGDDAAELFVAWNEAPDKSFQFFSPLWVGPIISQTGSDVTTHMRKCRSIALTNNPNIPEFRLPNESAAAEETNNMNGLLKFIAELLKLDPNSTEEQVRAALTQMAADNTSLKAAADAAKAEATTAQAAAQTAETSLANERNARIGLLLDGALADGRVTLAGKPAWESNLKKDFPAFSVALANEKKQVKTDSVIDPNRAKNPQGDVRGTILALVNEAKASGLTHDQAWAKVKSEHKELFALPA
jgi:uncharacterized protein YfiM (DUF2279 family)